jgi:hypothetical protein
MMNRAAVTATLSTLLSVSVASVAHADDVETTSAQTLVVVTPNAPVIVTNGQATSAPASVTTALAPPGAADMPPAPPAAPQNEDWNNVSHINGSIVPVGERNAYLYAAKKTNISSDPLAWMFGYYQIAGSHALSQNLAVSVELSGWSTENGNNTGYSVAATLPIYLKRTFSGPFLEPGLVVHHDGNTGGYYYDASCVDCTMTTSRDWAGPEVMIGWAWMFDSGLNMSAAFGAAKRVQDSQASSYSSSDPEPFGYFRVGYAF